jgi:hypothetical protein
MKPDDPMPSTIAVDMVEQAIDDLRKFGDLGEGEALIRKDEIISLVADNIAELNDNDRQLLAGELWDFFARAAWGDQPNA